MAMSTNTATEAASVFISVRAVVTSAGTAAIADPADNADKATKAKSFFFMIFTFKKRCKNAAPYPLFFVTANDSKWAIDALLQERSRSRGHRVIATGAGQILLI